MGLLIFLKLFLLTFLPSHSGVSAVGYHDVYFIRGIKSIEGWDEREKFCYAECYPDYFKNDRMMLDMQCITNSFHDHIPAKISSMTEANWGGTCKTGKSQSPIDINSNSVVNGGKIVWSFFHHYRMLHQNNPIINDGITVMIDATKIHTMTMAVHYPEETLTYLLLDIHFHWGEDGSHGSEHRIDGKKFAGEIHMVHVLFNSTNEWLYDPSTEKNHAQYLVIAFLIEEGDLRTQAYIPFLEALAGFNVDETTRRRKKAIKDYFDYFSLLPPEESFGYYSYQGSFTAPGCDERVTWAIVKKPILLLKEQMDEFRKMQNGGTSMRNNYRSMIQPLNNRVVTYYEPETVVIGIKNKATAKSCLNSLLIYVCLLLRLVY